MAADKAPSLVGVTVTTVGAGDYSCGAALIPPDVSVAFRAFNSGVFSDGDTFPYECRQGSTFERGRGTWHSSGNTITRTLITSNSNNNTAPITWGAGTKILFVDSGERVTARSVLGLGTSAVLDVGTTASEIVQLDGTGKLPVNTDISQCINVPIHYHSAIFATGFTGGSNSTILRYSSPGVLAAASLSDSVTALWPLIAKGSDGLYYRFGAVPFTGATAGNRYYLGIAGAISTTFSNGLNDIPDGTHIMVIVGFCFVNGILDFNPAHPYASILSSGTALKLEHGDLKV